MKKILIIRFSSIGDIIQCMSVTGALRKCYPDADIHWVTRSDMSEILYTDPDIDQVWAFDKEEGLQGLIRLGRSLQAQAYDLVYDAHRNLRSAVLCNMLSPWYRRLFGDCPRLLIRRKMRLRRILFFAFKWRSMLPTPFRGAESFLAPLVTGLDVEGKCTIQADKAWVFDKAMMDATESLLGDFHGEELITLVPSAAWPLKRWPVAYWCTLVQELKTHRFIILGGPKDEFCREIAAVAADRCLNLAGRTSLMQSLYVVYCSNYVVAGDTGFLHGADLFGIRGLALIGPAAFGYPSGTSLQVLEQDLPCKPCSKAGEKKCVHKEYQACMRQILPEEVIAKIKG